MDASLQVQGSIHDGILIIQFWTGVQKTGYISGRQTSAAGGYLPLLLQKKGGMRYDYVRKYDGFDRDPEPAYRSVQSRSWIKARRRSAEPWSAAFAFKLTLISGRTDWRRLLVCLYSSIFPAARQERLFFFLTQAVECSLIFLVGGKRFVTCKRKWATVISNITTARIGRANPC